MATLEAGLIMLTALLLDALLGEPRRWHPLVGYGHLVTVMERGLRRSGQQPGCALLAGGLAWLLLALLPVLALILVLAALPGGGHGWYAVLLELGLLYLCLGQRSLTDHARAVAAPLLRGELAAARLQLARIVSRDTQQLDAGGVTRATLESVLENGNDAVVGSLFWFALAGAPGALLHRLSNTLDARWGYRSSNYLYFGRVAARMDDLLNWVPARLCALAYSLAGQCGRALQCWREQAPLAASPNGGPVMAAGAGALGVRLGGPTRYRGEWQDRPVLGCAAPPQPEDIERALQLLRRAVLVVLPILLLINALVPAWR